MIDLWSFSSHHSSLTSYSSCIPNPWQWKCFPFQRICEWSHETERKPNCVRITSTREEFDRSRTWREIFFIPLRSDRKSILNEESQAIAYSESVEIRFPHVARPPKMRFANLACAIKRIRCVLDFPWKVLIQGRINRWSPSASVTVTSTFEYPVPITEWAKVRIPDANFDVIFDRWVSTLNRVNLWRRQWLIVKRYESWEGKGVWRDGEDPNKRRNPWNHVGRCGPEI